MEMLIGLIQKAGYIIKEINNMVHIPINIETHLSWGTILLMVALYSILKSYLIDKQLSSSELMKLLFIYLGIMSIIVASYVDLGKMLNRILEPRSHKSPPLFFVILMWIVLLTFIIGLLGTSKNNSTKMNLVLVLLYLPIILLMITNGRILEDTLESVRSIKPAFKEPFSKSPPAPGKEEKEDVKTKKKPIFCCRELDPAQVESVINLYEKVADSAVIVHKDKEDGVVKPYAFIVLIDSTVTDPARLKRKIKWFLKKRFKKEHIEEYKIPHWIEFISGIPRTKAGDKDRDALKNRITI